MSTIQEVARRAKVSKATVSRVLNGSAPVTQQTRKRVLDIIEELNFQPDTLARALATKRSGGIGVTVNDLGSPFYGAVLRGIESVLNASGMHLLVSSGHADALAERQAVEFLRRRRADALIIQADATPPQDLVEWASQDVPVVIFGRDVPAISERCVCLDSELGGVMATRHLLEAGHRRVAHISGPLAIPDSQARLQGYRRALEEAGLVCDERLVATGDFRETGGYEATQTLLSRGASFTAIFVGNDQMAVGALDALTEAGVRVPDDVSLIGFDDIMFAKYLSPKLTTIRQPLFEMGRAAAQLALELLTKKETGVNSKFEPELVMRQSVKTINQ
jgi:LacI family transcriptional regulator